MNTVKPHEQVVVLISLDHQTNLVSRLVQFFSDRAWNIIEFDHYSIEARFHARVCCNYQHTWQSLEELEIEIKQHFAGANTVASATRLDKKRFVGVVVDRPNNVLIDTLHSSGKGDLLSCILAFIASPDPDAELFANRSGVPFFSLSNKSSAEREATLEDLIKRYKTSLVGVSGQEWQFSARFLNGQSANIFGVQSAFVPVSVGRSLVETQTQWAVSHGARLIVATSFFFSSTIGQESIIGQRAKNLVFPSIDGETDLRRQQLESTLFQQTLAQLLACRVIETAQRSIVF